MNRNCPRRTPFKIKKNPSVPKKRLPYVTDVHHMFKPSERVFLIERKTKEEKIECDTCKGTGFLPCDHNLVKHKAHGSTVEMLECPRCNKGFYRKVTHHWEVMPERWVVDSVLAKITNSTVKISYTVKNMTNGQFAYSHEGIEQGLLFQFENEAVEMAEIKTIAENKWGAEIKRW